METFVVASDLKTNLYSFTVHCFLFLFSPGPSLSGRQYRSRASEEYCDKCESGDRVITEIDTFISAGRPASLYKLMCLCHARMCVCVLPAGV